MYYYSSIRNGALVPAERASSKQVLYGSLLFGVLLAIMWLASQAPSANEEHGFAINVYRFESVACYTIETYNSGINVDIKSQATYSKGGH